jgi:recombination directionality factor gp3-like protein
MSELARFDPDTGELYGVDVPPIWPVADSRPTWHEAGRIRIGIKVPIPGKPGKFRPAKLTRFRLTSPDQALIERAAELYGGEPEPWDDAPGAERDGGEQWQVTTLRNALPVRIPPAAAATQAWEAWSGGGCERRCDGRWELFTDSACICTAEAEFAIGEGRTYERPCRKTTRVSVMLEELPGAGIWRLETHSTISGDELATWLRIVFPYLPPMAPLVLRVQKTERKRRVPSQKHERGWDWQTFVFPLVSIDTRDQTIGQLLAQRAVPAPPPVAEVAGRVVEQTSGAAAPSPPVGPAALDPTSEAGSGGPLRGGATVDRHDPASGDQSPEPNPRPMAAAGSGEPRPAPSTSPEGGGAAGGRRRGGRAAPGRERATDSPPAEPGEEAEQAAFEQTIADDDPGKWTR